MDEQVPVGQQLDVLESLRVVPLMHDAALGIEQIGVMPADGAEQRVPGEGLRLVPVDEPERTVADPRHVVGQAK